MFHAVGPPAFSSCPQTPQGPDPFLFISISPEPTQVPLPSGCPVDVSGVMNLHGFHPCLLDSPFALLCSGAEGLPTATPQGRPHPPWQVFLCLAPVYKTPTPKLSFSLIHHSQACMSNMALCSDTSGSSVVCASFAFI